MLCCPMLGEVWHPHTYLTPSHSVYILKKKIRCGFIANETALHKRPNDTNDTEINSYRSPYGL